MDEKLVDNMVVGEGAAVGEEVTRSVVRRFRSLPDEDLLRIRGAGISDQRRALIDTIMAERRAGRQVPTKQLVSSLQEQRGAVPPGVVFIEGQGFSVAPEQQEAFIREEAARRGAVRFRTAEISGVAAPTPQVQVTEEAPQILQPETRPSLVEQEQGFQFTPREAFFIRDEGGRITDINIGGQIRSGFRFGAEIIETGLVAPAREKDTGLFGRLARTDIAQIKPEMDVGQLGLELFLAPGFGIRPSFMKLAEPRTIFRQPVPKPIIKTGTTITPLESGEAKVFTKITTTQPARFELQQSPLDQLLGRFGEPAEIVKISKARRFVTLAEGRTADSQIAGVAFRRGDKRTTTEIFDVFGRVEETATLKPLEISEKRALREITGMKKPLIAISEDVKMFRTGGEAVKTLKISGIPDKRLSVFRPAPGRRITRVAGVSFTRPVPGREDFFQVTSGQADISRSIIGRSPEVSRGLIRIKQPKIDIGIEDVGRVLKFKKTTPSQKVALAKAFEQTIVKVSKPPKPFTSPKVKLEGTTVKTGKPILELPEKTQQGLQTRITGLGRQAQREKFAFALGEETAFFKPPAQATISQVGLKAITVPRIAPSQKVGLGQVPVSAIVTIPTTKQIPKEPRLGDFPIVTPFRFASGISPRIRRGFPFAFLPPLGFPQPVSKRKKPKRKLRRQPSLIAAALDIKAPRAIKAEEETGLAIRPLLR